MTNGGASENSVGYDLSSENWVVGVARSSGRTKPITKRRTSPVIG